jgi:hypothetical protein
VITSRIPQSLLDVIARIQASALIQRNRLLSRFLGTFSVAGLLHLWRIAELGSWQYPGRIAVEAWPRLLHPVLRTETTTTGNSAMIEETAWYFSQGYLL